MVLSRDIIISITIYPTSFLKLSYYLNIKWVISSTNSKILTNLHHDRFIFERRRPLLKQCIMGSVSSTSIMDFHKPPTVHSFLSVTTLCFLTNLVSIWRLLSPCWSAYIIAWSMRRVAVEIWIRFERQLDRVYIVETFVLPAWWNATYDVQIIIFSV